MKREFRTELKKKLPWLVAIILITLLYFFLNVPDKGLIITRIALDSYIPFIPAFVVAYFFFYIFVFGTVLYSFLKHNKNDFKLLAVSMIVANIIAYIMYFFFQSEDIRPLLSNTGIFSSMLGFIYYLDHVYNSFPSGHAYLTTIIALYWLDGMKKQHKILIISLSLLIIASTLFIKQHFIIDSLGGIVLGVISFFAVKHCFLRNKKEL